MQFYKKVHFLKEGDVLALPILTETGTVLLNSGAALTDDQILRIRNFEIDDVLIDDGFLNIDEKEDVLLEQFKLEQRHDLAAIEESITTIAAGQITPKKQLDDVVYRLLDRVCMDKNIALRMIYCDLAEDDIIYHHSINVCNLVVVIGNDLGLTIPEIEVATKAALLHDIGMLQIREYWDHDKKISDTEFDHIKTHSQIGREMIRETVPDLDPIIAKIVLQHHERMSGSGYPNGITGADMNKYAMVLALADVYEALISSRKFRSGMSPQSAMGIIMASGRSLFDIQCLKAFMSTMALYPVGSVVQLNTGEFAQVIGTNNNSPFRPLIKIFYDAQKVRYDQCRRVNMSQKEHSSYTIDVIVDPQEHELKFSSLIM